MPVLEDIANAVVVGRDEDVPGLIEQALNDGVSAKSILNEGLLAGMTEVGRRFSSCEYFIPEVLVAAEAMKAGTSLLKPHLAQLGNKPVATALIGTVKGDLHDIGKTLVSNMLEGAGFEVIDLGVDVPPERFAETCSSREINLIAVSALLTTTMSEMERTVSFLKSQLDPCPFVIVGGAPVTQEFADRIGADGYGRDAASGAEVARRLCLQKN